MDFEQTMDLNTLPPEERRKQLALQAASITSAEPNIVKVQATTPAPAPTPAATPPAATTTPPAATTTPPATTKPAGAPVVTPPATTMVEAERQTTTTREKGFKPSAEAIRLQEGAVGALEQSAKSQAEAQRKQLEVEAAGAELLQQKTLEEEKKIQEQRDQYKTNLANELKNYDKAYTDLAEANKIQINPRRFIDNMSTGSKIMVGLGLLLSGFGGGESVMRSMSIINKAIDDDVAGQKINKEGQIEAAKTGIASIDRKVNSIKSELKDDMVFNELQRDLRLDAVKSQIENMRAKAKEPAIQAKLDESLAIIEQQRADNKMKLEQMARDKVSTTTVTREERQVAPGRMTKEQSDRADKYREEILKDVEVKKSLDTLSKLAAVKASLAVAETGDAAAMEATASAIASAVQQGALTEGDVARASGVPVDIIGKGKDAIAKYLRGVPGPNQLATMKKMIEGSEQAATSTYQQRIKGYEEKARSDLGFTEEQIRAARPVTPSAVIGSSEDEAKRKRIEELRRKQAGG